jgi:3'(2'), 5'-bisphosphate nucleotidase
MIRQLDASRLLAELRMIARRAGEAILEHYRAFGPHDDAASLSASIELRHKSDASPVTAADEASEAIILEALATLAPGVPVVSEEAAARGVIPDVSAGNFFLVDPLDGTEEFLTKNGEFTVNIALIEQGVPVAGVVLAPALSRTWFGARGVGAFRGDALAQPVEIRARRMPETGAIVVVSRRHGDVASLEAYLTEFKVDRLVSAGSSLKLCLVASGDADLYPRFGRTMEWDIAAGHAVLLAAGGRVMTLDGEELRYGKSGFENPHFVARGRPITTPPVT